MKLKIIFLLTFICTCTTSFAQTIEQNGIKYELIGPRQTATVIGTGAISPIGSVTIPSIINYFGVDYSVIGIRDGAFYNNSDITSFILPNSITTIGDGAFQSCSALTSVVLPNALTIINYSLFESCSALETINIPSTVTYIQSSAFINCTLLSDIVFPTNLTGIGNYAFSNCTSLTGVTIPDSVNDFGDAVFNGCTGLTTATVGTGITFLSSTFSYCTSLTTVNLPNTITNINNRAFTNCTSLMSINLPSSLTNIGTTSFAYCSSLTSIAIPNSVTYIDEFAFSYCSSLSTVSLSNTLAWLGDGAFEGCSSLTSIVLPNSLNSNLRDGVFLGCNSLASVVYPNTISYIPSNTFKNCSSLITFTIPPSVTSINAAAFDGCISLNSITIPDSVGSLNYGVFQNCTGLTSVVLSSILSDLGQYCFRNCTSLSSVKARNPNPIDIYANNFDGVTLANVSLYVPTNSIGSYNNTPVWKDFSPRSGFTFEPRAFYIANISSSFNADIIANDDNIINTTTADVDGAGNYLVATGYNQHGFVYNTMPANDLFMSPRTPNLQLYIPTFGLNSLRITDQNTGTVDITDLKLTAKKLFLLATAGESSSDIKVTVNFDDNTSQQISSYVNDWYAGAGNYALKGISSTNETAVNDDSYGPRIYEIELNIDPQHADKKITTINIEKNYFIGVVHIMGLSVELANVYVCPDGTVQDIYEVIGDNKKYYTAFSGGTQLPDTTPVVNNTTYYITQTKNGIESDRVPFLVKFKVVALPVANGNQSLAKGSIIFNLVATGSQVRWYAAATGGSALDNGTILVNGTTYYATQYVDGCVSGRVPVTVTLTTTWNGSSWNQGIPTANVKAIINGNYTATSNITAYALDVTGTAIVNVPSGFNFTITGKVTVATTASLTFENNANLIQDDNIQNSGNITIKRNSAPLMLLDYTLWSSPVAGQQLQSFSPATLSTRFYTYNPATDKYNATSPTVNFATGTGYLIRMPNNHPTTPTIWNGSFTGIPNNGTISLTVANNTYNAIGNPYPSTISADAFIDTNALTDALYFWRKTNNAATTSYATYTTAGGTANAGGLSSIVPNDAIAVGQGFIAKSTSTALVFTNAIRTANNAAPFLKTKAIEKNRIWLNLSKDNEPINQMMVAYMNGATAGIDPAIDGKYINDSPIALNSIIKNEEFVIQGRGLPFDDTDAVPLTFKTDVIGNYTIDLDHADGLFLGNQEVFLNDKTLGTSQNLKKGRYAFASASGTFNNRFELVYKTSNTLGLTEQEFSNSVLVFKQNGLVNINAGNTIMKTVRVFDIQGRLIFKQEKVNQNTTVLKGFTAAEQTIFVQITSDDDKIVTKKVIY